MYALIANVIILNEQYHIIAYCIVRGGTSCAAVRCDSPAQSGVRAPPSSDKSPHARGPTVSSHCFYPRRLPLLRNLLCCRWLVWLVAVRHYDTTTIYCCLCAVFPKRKTCCCLTRSTILGDVKQTTTTKSSLSRGEHKTSFPQDSHASFLPPPTTCGDATG